MGLHPNLCTSGRLFGLIVPMKTVPPILAISRKVYGTTGGLDYRDGVLRGVKLRGRQRTACADS